jgi:hypothetical protein
MTTILGSSYLQINGLTTMGWEDSGVQWITENVTGLGGTGTTSKPVQKPRHSGAWAGKGYATARVMVATGTTAAPTPALALDALDRMNTAFTRDESPMTVNQSGIARTVNARRDGEIIPTWLSAVAFKWSVQLVAVDWRMFGAPIVLSTGVLATSGGLQVPFTVPTPISSTVSSGQIVANNPGNETGPVLLRIDGPWPGGSIAHAGSGLAFTFSASLALAAGEWLNIDMENKTVLANGQATRRQYVTSAQWFGFDPGPNVLLFSATSSAPSALLTATQTPAWG